MLFSIIIATRDRPQLFREAIDSVLAQRLADSEIIVVNDGTSEAHMPAYRAMEAELAGRARFYHLVRRPNGHGQSYSLNFGVAQSRGDYVCFLDDDDCWTDSGYLERVGRTLGACETPADLHFTNQAAFRDGVLQPGPIWVEDLADILDTEHRAPDAGAGYFVKVRDLLRCGGFCHLNTTVVRAAFFNAIGGMDENIRWECDRDFYLRAIDRAEVILYDPAKVSRHNIPNPAQKGNMSTVISDLEKRLFQVRVLDKAILFSSNSLIRDHGRRHKAYALKRIAEGLAAAGRYRSAAYFAKEALLSGFSPKWLGYSLYLTARGIWNR